MRKKKPGRKKFLTEQNMPEIAQLLFGEDKTYREVALRYKCSESTLKHAKAELEQCYDQSQSHFSKLKQKFASKKDRT
jgi:DNA invertase Pin-like site-specific DNA recombinase